MQQLKVIVVFLFFTSFLYGQQPYAHQLTTEDGLPTNEVYDILQDTKGYIWVATDNGLVRYDGKKFTQIPTNININQSFTSLLETSQGQIWCFGFPANIMYVENDSLKRLMDFSPKTQDYPILYLDQHDILNIAGDSGIYRFNTIKHQWEDIEAIRFDDFRNNYYYYNNKEIADPRIPEEYNAAFTKQTYLPPSFSKKLVYRQGFFKKIKHKLLYFYNHNRIPTVAFEYRNDSLILFDSINQWLNTNRIVHFTRDKDSSYLFSTVNGIQGMDKNFQPLFPSPWFPNTTFSAILRDFENNLWASSTSLSLCIFPSLKTQIYTPTNSDLQDLDIAELESDGEQLFIGLKNGTIQRLNKKNQFEVIHQANEKTPFLRMMVYNPKMDELIYSTAFVYCYKSQSKELIQFHHETAFYSNDVSFRYDNDYLFSERGRCALISNPKDSTRLKKTWEGYQYFYHPYLKERNTESILIKIRNKRSECNAYNPYTDTYWVAYIDRLSTYKNGLESTFTIDGEDIKVFDITITDLGSTWIASNNGLYEVTIDGNIQHYTAKDGLLKNNVKRIIYQNDKLYLIFQSGFQVFDYNKNTFTTYNKSDGLPSSEIRDIQIFDQQLFVATAQGLMSFTLDYDPINRTPPRLNIKGISINETALALSNTYEFQHEQNNLLVTYDILAYRSLGNYQLKYWLQGHDEDWIIQEKPSNELRFSNLQPGNYTLNLIAINEDGTPSKNHQVQFYIAPPFYATWWFWSLMVIGLLCFGYVFYRNRIHSIQKDAAIQQQLISSEMKAIKSQMNPHFIFNALNSIQDLMLKKDIRTSNKYLVKFSNLVREVLNLSSEEFITIEQELNLLTLYVELEKLRFGEDLSFQINYNIEEFAAEELVLPPLIIQPYVENSFKHGLLHRSGAKKLLIEFRIQHQKLLCIIEDNGVGRSRSNQINQRRTNKIHQSFATKANQKRIDLINATQEQNIDLKIMDLPNQGGTRVEILFPLIPRN